MAADFSRTSHLRKTTPWRMAIRLPILCICLGFLALGGRVEAASGSLEVTATYRERIALPPGAELVVSLLDLSRPDGLGKKISVQRFAMTGVPMTVVLDYDLQLVEDGGQYALHAALWSDDGRLLFRSEGRHDAFADGEPGPVEMLLISVPENVGDAGGIGSISGIQWAATEVAGDPWANDDPATLTVDEDLGFSMFGGCNRYVGTLSLEAGELAFPENFAGTLMACPEEVEAMERRFLTALRQSDRYLRYGSGLVLVDVNGRATAHFVARPE